MTRKLYDLMNWADVEEIVYAESTYPRRILGPHLIKEGLLIQTYVPTAKKVSVSVDGGKYRDMELADESGFYAVLLPKMKAWELELPSYTYRITYDNDATVIYEDPYAYDSVLSEDDIDRLQSGIWYESYEKMGAHPVVLDGVPGIVFIVFAPNAERVSVVGDFNLWDGRRHQMEKQGETGIFELFIPRLPSGTIYKYEIKPRHHEPFLKIDPYGFSFELRPDNACIVTDIDNFVWTDEKWQKQKEELGSTGMSEQPMSVYEMHLGSFLQNSIQINEDGSEVNGSQFLNYRELAPKIAEYVKKQGFTHIELMPVMEHPLDASWGYQVSGYYAPTSRYGTPEDFAFFMDYMHSQGIGVILDWVPAHFPRDSWGLAQFDGSSLYENPDPVLASHPHWGTLTFNYRRNEISNFLISNAFFWADKYHADGIRMDAVASMLYLDYGRQGNAPVNRYGGNDNLDAVEFIKHLNSQFHIHFPGTLLIAEESTAWAGVTEKVENGGLGFDLKWNMGWMNDFLSYVKVDPYFRKGSYHQLTFSMLYYYAERFMQVFSHDEVVHGKGSLLAKMPQETFEDKAENLRAAFGYFWAYPGKKLLFMGQDYAENDEWSESRSLEWDLLQYPVHHSMQQYVADLNRIYMKQPALWKLDYRREGFRWINCSYNELSLLMFIRKTENPEETVLVVTNFDNVCYEKFRVGVPFLCTAKALISSDDEKYGGKGIVRRHARKASKIRWDEQEYAVRLDIPAMSTTMYQLTPVIEAAESVHREKAAGKNKKENAGGGKK